MSDAPSFGAPTGAPSINRTLTIANGTSAGQANSQYWVKGSCASGSPATYDLTSLTLAGFNTARNFSAVKVLEVFGDDDNQSTYLLYLGGGSNYLNPLANAIWFGAKDFFVMPATSAGYAVSGSCKNIVITTDGAATTYFSLKVIGIAT